MSETQTYRQKRLPDLIKRLKSQVKKNLKIINREVETDLSEDKNLNILKGRRLAIEECIKTLEQIDRLNGAVKENSYKREIMPILITNIKEMVDINLDIVDVDIEEGNSDDYKVLTEDKYIQVIKARAMASDDVEFALLKIDELENELKGTELKREIPKSWSKVAAEG